MFGQDSASNRFLTPEEAAQVEKALLSSREKFTARVAIYSLRVLKQISQEQDMDIAAISHGQIVEWVSHDQSVQNNAVPELGQNDSFQFFFSKLVVSSLKPLHQISNHTDTPIESLSINQVIHWFEQDAKTRIDKSRQ